MGGSERATFLFTDIEDSCGLWERDTAGMEVDLEKHDRVLREAVESRAGRIFRSAGDSVLARFESAADAVKAAIDAQLRLRATVWGEATPIRVRMAIHDGEAQGRAGDFYGPALNRCARILGVAYGDQILLSRSIRDSVENQLSSVTNLKPLGKVHLRGLEGPEEIYQVGHPGLKADFPPLAGLDTSPHNLPVQLTSFVGRNRDLREINKLLSASRIVTLTGPGGCGKTRLSLKLGEQVLEEFVDGVWFVELHALTNQDAVAGAVASVFSVAERTGQTIEEALAEWLQPKKALIIIDNCEHLLEGVSAFVGGMSAQCPNLKWLLTSRGPVHVHGEAIYRVPTLSVPEEDETRLASITRCAAVKLFTDRASVISSFNLTSASAPHVASICRRLDGMPLAIEVAASWTKALAPRQIAERLGKHLDLLHRASPSKLSKHETLRAAIDWSYDLLVDQERRLFRQLAVFSGGWTLEAAEQVCQLEIDPIHVLASLIDKSLVMTEEGLAGELRYRYLETIREYALERFSETGDEVDVRRRHLQYFMSFAHEAEKGMTGDAQAEWMSRIDLERGNLRAAMRSGLDLDETEPALKMAVSLWRYWYYHGQFSEGSKWLHDLLDGA
ncbi:MAG: adenylate/guanylate cyclase domain-containing protein, partial [Armatimonadetes bacterium]|nr:adenylate/guanylate cyclase domain-containing protein [Armatimonadota bacterium]